MKPWEGAYELLRLAAYRASHMKDVPGEHEAVQA